MDAPQDDRRDSPKGSRREYAAGKRREPRTPDFFSRNPLIYSKMFNAQFAAFYADPVFSPFVQEYEAKKITLEQLKEQMFTFAQERGLINEELPARQLGKRSREPNYVPEPMPRLRRTDLILKHGEKLSKKELKQISREHGYDTESEHEDYNDPSFRSKIAKADASSSEEDDDAMREDPGKKKKKKGKAQKRPADSEASEGEDPEQQDGDEDAAGGAPGTYRKPMSAKEKMKIIFQLSCTSQGIFIFGSRGTYLKTVQHATETLDKTSLSLPQLCDAFAGKGRFKHEEISAGNLQQLRLAAAGVFGCLTEERIDEMAGFLEQDQDTGGVRSLKSKSGKLSQSADDLIKTCLELQAEDNPEVLHLQLFMGELVDLLQDKDQLKALAKDYHKANPGHVFINELLKQQRTINQLMDPSKDAPLLKRLRASYLDEVPTLPEKRAERANLEQMLETMGRISSDELEKLAQKEAKTCMQEAALHMYHGTESHATKVWFDALKKEGRISDADETTLHQRVEQAKEMYQALLSGGELEAVEEQFRMRFGRLYKHTPFLKTMVERIISKRPAGSLQISRQDCPEPEPEPEANASSNTPHMDRFFQLCTKARNWSMEGFVYRLVADLAEEFRADRNKHYSVLDTFKPRLVEALLSGTSVRMRMTAEEMDFFQLLKPLEETLKERMPQAIDKGLQNLGQNDQTAAEYIEYLILQAWNYALQARNEEFSRDVRLQHTERFALVGEYVALDPENADCDFLVGFLKSFHGYLAEYCSISSNSVGLRHLPIQAFVETRESLRGLFRKNYAAIQEVAGLSIRNLLDGALLLILVTVSHEDSLKETNLSVLMKHVQAHKFLYIKQVEVQVITISDDEAPPSSDKDRARKTNEPRSAKAAKKPTTGSAAKTGARADERPEIVGAPSVALSLTTKCRKMTIPEVDHVLAEMTEEVLRVMKEVDGSDDADGLKPLIGPILTSELKMCNVHLTSTQTIGTQRLMQLRDWLPYFVTRTPAPLVFNKCRDLKGFKKPGMDFVCFCAQIGFKAKAAKNKQFDQNGWLKRIEAFFRN